MKRQRDNEVILESLDLANCLRLLSYHAQQRKTQKSFAPEEFECKTCSRKFSSFQALGGHRASHKKPKLDGFDQLKAQEARSLKPKMHECSICGMEFSLGQALGGHMRRHRAAINEPFKPLNQEVPPVIKGTNTPRVMFLDLNLTPLENDLKLLFGNMTPKIEAVV